MSTGAGEEVKPVVSDGEVRGLIRHYTRMSKLPGTVNYDKVAALLTELLARRKAK